MYFVSMAIIAFNLVMAGASGSARVNDRPDYIIEYVGSSGDISGYTASILGHYLQNLFFYVIFQHLAYNSDINEFL